MSDSNELSVKWFGCHLIWDSNDFGCQLIWDSIDLVVNWFEIQMIWLSIAVCFKWFWLSVGLNFKWCGCQLIWVSSDSVVNWSEIQVIWLSTDLRFKWVGCQLIWDSNDLDVKWFEVQVIWLSTDVWFKWFCQTKPFCETSFKIEALKIKNEAFVRDFLQNWSFEAQKWSFSARLPSKLKLWSSKTKLFCETSFKNEALKIKNEAFLRDFLQKWHVDQTLGLRITNVLAIFKWMLQKYYACHEKVAPTHTKSCNCHAKWSLQSNTSMTWNLQPFHGFCVRGFKHRHHKPQNPCACHAKRIVSDPLQIHHACQRFCDPDKLLRLQRILQPVEIPAPATRNTLSTSKNVPSPWCFNDFDFQIVRARRRGANFP